MSKPQDDATADLLIREVDEDLRQENLEKIWKKYGIWFVAAAVAVVLAVAGAQAWRSWQHNQAVIASQRFLDASQALDGNDKAKGVDVLTQLAGNGPSGYRLLAELKLAQVKMADGDTKGAIAQYDKIASDSSVDELYRQLAVLKSAYLKLETADAAQIEKSVAPLAVESGAWRHSAREILALLALKTGDKAKALDYLRKIADDVAAPAGIRGRAAELLAALEGAAKG